MEVRLSKACSYCKNKKIKCDGSLPCGNCFDRNNRCVYPPKPRRLRRKSGYTQRAAEQLQRAAVLAEPLYTAEAVETSPTSDAQPSKDFQTDSVHAASMIVFSLADPHSANHHTEPSDDLMDGQISLALPSPTVHSKSPQMHKPQNSSSVHHAEPLTPSDSEVDREEATIDLQHVNWQHHGPGSWLSICSEPGTRWVCGKIGSKEFTQIAKGLTLDWTKHLTFSQHPLRGRGPEIDEEAALRYVRAYFENSNESVFGVVYRPGFENSLYRHFHTSNWEEEDVASYALRNAVYAIGCRASALLETDRNFAEVQEKSLQFFFNAFSVLQSLLYMPSGLEAVQAVIIMVSYSEMLGSPAVEYMLTAAATRLAQSKGLHRQPAKSWHLSSQEVLQRNWTFWAVYCHDKYLALRSGRPSAIDDDDISCEIPTEAPIGSTMDVRVFTATVRHAQICAEMMKRLFSVKSLKASREVLLREMHSLEDRLEKWRISVPEDLFSSNPTSLRNASSHRIQASITRLQMAYYGSIITLHCNINYPWLCPRPNNQVEVTSGDALAISAARTAQAARQILKLLQHEAPDLGSSMPIAFYYPMLAIINLFIHILKYPASANARSDLALLDIGSGHFGKINYLTQSHVSFRFPREVVRLADTLVQDAAANTQNLWTGSPPTKCATGFTDFGMSKQDNFVNSQTADLMDSDMNSEQWSYMSAGFFEELFAGDMIIP